MTPIAAVEAIATLLWAYAGVTFLAWARHLTRAEHRQRVPHVIDLIANLVPAMILLLVVVLVGAVIGLPSVVVLIAVLFPAGLAWGAQMALNDIRETATPAAEAARIALALAIGSAVIWARQIA
ncbi:hypothetical protein [Roseicyclus persicicus]|uniref:Uncharacterized protein n=1 Tax=Roseicyclus persicicus TaxID=2650661 RepID=A0A7X6JYJ2_9RHOB|nr:hypothetical protein [Roseibacterium persicicum]NKX45885.1 hypothetical protein [Roseibacterium persicicum]